MDKTNTNMFRLKATALVVAGVVCAPGNVSSAPTSLANLPLATGLSGVAPNIMFILDNSGSMSNDRTPDNVNGNFCRHEHQGNATSRDNSTSLQGCDWGDPLYNSPNFNFQYYSPNILYRAPFHPSDLGKAEDDNTRVYPSYNNVGSNQKWSAVKKDVFADDGNVPDSTTVDITTQGEDAVACNLRSPSTAQMFTASVCRELIEMTTVPPGEDAGTGIYMFPNPKFNATSYSATAHFQYRIGRTGTSTNPIVPYFYTISQLTWCKNRSATAVSTGFTTSKLQYGKGTTNTAAAAFSTNPCNDRQGTIGGTNYQFPKFGKVAHTATNDTANQNAYLNATTPTPGIVGVTDFEGISGFRRWNITNPLPAGYPANNFGGVAGAVAPERADCAPTGCTYAQEMTNYANWFAYYRRRIQAMKTAASRAFEPIGATFRIGFITICPNSSVNCSSSPWTASTLVQGTQYQRIDYFDATNKPVWYNKLFAASTSAFTPLREALSRVGQVYAGKIGGAKTSLTNGIPAADDPVIASCQQNFALLTTDGQWNGPAGQKVDGTAIGDQDDNIATAPRPFYDGPNTGSQTATDTLADVAFYYYITDLRPTMAPNVPTTAKDTNQDQHMTTFTLGLGVDGQLGYDPNYEGAQSGDFFNITQGSLNWPKPVADSATAVDDLWHAAVNGRGKYFSARDPQALSSGLNQTLDEVKSRQGAGAAAATSSLRPSAGDQLAFTAQFETVFWDGDLSARTIDVNTSSSTFGQVSTTSLWSAQELLDKKQWDTRNILMFDPTDIGAGDRLKSFCWTSGGTGCTNGSGMTAAEKTYFDVSCPTRSIILNQPWTGSCLLGGSGQIGAATGQKLVQYLRGDRSNEGTGIGTTQLFRPRSHVLGDIVNAQPVYVKKPPFDYVDNNYTTFKNNNVSRQAIVFAAANDGMLHAFQVDPDGDPYFQDGGFATATTGDDTFKGTNDGGNEAWAFIPTAVLPQLHNLANSNPFGHLYYVDGSPVVGDVCDSVPCSSASAWHTILVAGLNHGGRGYYALDITDPLNPKGLWEFVVDPANPPACLTDAQAASGTFNTDCNLGYTYGQPVITKWKATASGNDGRWVVLVTSGYNNYSPGDGRGYLYMLDAITGKILGRVTTGVGSGGTSAAGFSDADPSGLAKINAWLENGLQNNTAEQVYGGDLLGNLWRFDVADADPTKWKAVLITVAKALDGTIQPITIRPELGKPRGQRAVFFGTGRYIGDTDPAITQKQTIYGIKDDLSGTVVDSLGGAVVTRTFAPETTLADGTIARTISTSGTALDFSSPTQSGFRVDLPGAGERVNVDPVLQVGTLVVASNFPETNSCTAGGSAWENYVDFATGFSVKAVGGEAGARKFSSGLIVGTTIVQLPGGKTVAITTSADTKQTTSSITGGGSGSGSLTGKRSAWRELMTE